METPKSLGAELKKARQTCNYSLRDVEELTEISNAYLSQLENDKIKSPATNVLYKLAQIYRIKFDLLLKVAGVIKAADQDTVAKGNTPKTLAGSALYSEELTAEEEEALAEYLRFLRFRRKDGLQ